MERGVSFGVLGPVVAYREDQEIDLGTPTARKALATLLCRPGRAVSAEELIDSIWPESPPATARKTLQVYVHRLRQALGGPERIRHSPAGYVLQPGDGEIDAVLFERLSREAAGCADPGRAIALYERALRLWRGRAYADADGSPLIGHEAQRLEELRLGVLEHKHAIEADLRPGGELIADLTRLAQEYPYRERLREILMLALARSGRQAEALEVYRQTRALLAGELGVEPGPDLRQLHETILRGETHAAMPPPQEKPPPPVAQLPPIARDFTGRHEPLSTLDSLAATEPSAGSPTIAVVTGSGGAGKTALAVRWAHSLADRFPDGQLFVNLRGFDNEPPMRPVDAVVGFLRALGCSPESIPAELEPAAAAFRSRAAGRRLLVVLDNAASADQVEPLLPATATCFVLITSRDRLTGLVARHGAHRIRLGALTPGESADLLGRVLGTARVAAEAAAATDLAQVCAHLPLALRIAAATLLDYPDRSLAEHVADLRQGDRLSALSIAGDEHFAVRTVFSQSYTSLAPNEQMLFRLLGLAPGQDLSLEAVSALAGLSTSDIGRSLDRLAAGNLVDPRPGHRYLLHDLLQMYALEQAESQVGPQARREALHRLYDHYLQRVSAAARRLYPHLTRLVDTPGFSFADNESAVAWLEAERVNLLAAISYEGDLVSPEWRYLLADALRGYFWMGMLILDWFTAAKDAIAAAESTPDMRGRAAAHCSLALAYFRVCDLPRTRKHFQHALDASLAAGWLDGQSVALDGLGSALLYAGSPSEAEGYHRRALEISRGLGREGTIANVLSNLGCALLRQGHAQQAEEVLLESLAIFRRIESGMGQALASCNLADVCREVGRYDDGLAYARTAAKQCADTGNESGEAITLTAFAHLLCEADKPAEALVVAGRACELISETNDPYHEAEAVFVLGKACERSGLPDRAIQHYRHALNIASSIGAQALRAQTSAWLAERHRLRGDLDEADSAARQALSLAEEFGYAVVRAKALQTLSALETKV